MGAPIKASDETKKRLRMLAGKLQARNGKRKSLQDAIIYALNFLDEHEKGEKK